MFRLKRWWHLPVHYPSDITCNQITAFREERDYILPFFPGGVKFPSTMFPICPDRIFHHNSRKYSFLQVSLLFQVFTLSILFQCTFSHSTRTFHIKCLHTFELTSQTSFKSNKGAALWTGARGDLVLCP